MWRRLRASRDAGLTMAELVVTMGLSTLIGAMTLSLFLSIQSSATATTDRTVNSAAARTTLQSWTAYLRVADGPTAGVRTSRIEWLTSKDLLFYADLYNRGMNSSSDVATTSAPTMIWLRRDAAGSLVEEQFASTAAAGTSPKVCRVLLTKTDTTTSLFTAQDSSGASMMSQNLGAAPTASTGCQKLPITVPSQASHPDLTAQSNLQTVFSVTIDFVVRDTRGKRPLEFISQAVLPAMGGVG
jgi:type II secretory pathway component PulJ